jgi:glycosyltransferase involved in cell wall biosynthesis
MTGRAAKIALLPLWLRRQIIVDDVDVGVCMLTFTNLVGLVALKMGRPLSTALVISERNMPSMLLPRFGASGRLQLRLARRIYRRADAALAISHPVAGDLVSGLRMPPARTFVVPNPVVDNERPEVANAPPRRIRVGYVGRLVAQKRPELFIGVLEELLKREIAIEGVMIGDGVLRDAMEKLAQVKGVPIRLLGWVEPWTISAGEFDCLLLPSAVEGFGNVLVEAAAHDIPCVASSLALGVADALVPGLTGELAMDDTPGAFADAILRAVNRTEPDPLKRWLRRFSTRNSAAELLQVLEKVVSSSWSTTKNRR